MRSYYAHGPYEGDEVQDREGTRLGKLDELVVHGRHVSALRVRFDDGDVAELPREWIASVFPHSLQLKRSRDEIDRYVAED